MRLLDVDPATAEDALVAVAEHVPPSVTIGLPRLAWRDGDTVAVLCDVPGSEPIMWEVGCGCCADQTITEGGTRTIVRWRRGAVIDLITEEG